MWKGDSLTVILWLLGGALATMIGALTAAPGWRTKVLWGLFGAFTLAGFAWVAAPTASPFVQAVSPFIEALIDSNFIAMVGTVGVVALIVSGRTAPAQRAGPIPKATSGPKFAERPDRKSNWSPDFSFSEGLNYFGTDAGQAGYHDKVEDVINKLVSALTANKITAWGKDHPSDMEFQIKPDFWNWAEVTLETNYVFSGHLNCGAFDVRLSKEQMRTVWPPTKA